MSAVIESKHTPGPWEAVPIRLRLERTEAYDIVCGDGDDQLILVNDVASEADAYLIAAAPDLLDAAKALIAVVDDMQIRTVALNSRLPLYERAADLLDAIAKAEGTNP